MDGYCRMVMFLKGSNNNRANTGDIMTIYVRGSRQPICSGTLAQTLINDDEARATSSISTTDTTTTSISSSSSSLPVSPSSLFFHIAQ
ncbi:unnamed protein product [Boreogadus saida]